MQKNEKGALFVEASLVLPLFVFVMLMLYSFITMYTIHEKMQNAINQTAGELSVYSYLYSYTGMRNLNINALEVNDKNLADADAHVGSVRETVEDVSKGIDMVNGIMALALDGGVTGAYENLPEIEDQANKLIEHTQNTIESGKENFEDIAGYAKELAENPETTGKMVVTMVITQGTEAIKSGGPAMLYSAMTLKNLGGTSSYEQMGITNVRFDNSSLWPSLTAQGDGASYATMDCRLIEVVVTYDYILPCSQAFKKGGIKFSIIQRSTAVGWCRGDESGISQGIFY